MSERKKHIAVLKEMLEWMNMSSEVIKKDDPFFRVHEHRKKAVKYAISSLETDEAYQLEYEKPEFCEDCVPRKVVERIIKSPRSQEQMLTMLNNTSSVLPKADKPTIVEEMKFERDVLDKLRAELHATAEMHEDGDYYIRDEWIDEYFDKYKTESEDNNA